MFNLITRINFWRKPTPITWKETVFKQQEPFLPFLTRFIPETRDTENVDLLFEVLKAKYIFDHKN